MSFAAAAGTTSSPREERDVSMADARQWYDALKELAGSDVDDPAMAQDAILRSRASVLTARDMRLVLLATADTPAWARQTVMDDLVLHLERARQVLSTHTQIEVWPSLRFQTDDHPAQKTAAAVIGPAGAEVTGPVQSAPTSREAKDRAALALLARLVGVALPGEPADQAPPGRLVLPVMPTEVFEQRLRRQVEVGQAPGAELEEEVLQRARASRLRHRDLYLLLLVAGGEAWTAARKAALDRAVAMPPAPARLLHWHAEQYGEDHGLTYQEDPVDEHGRHHTRARFTTPEETRLGPRRSATARKAARHQAAGALLAQLAGLTEPAPPNDGKPSSTPKITVPDKNQDPVKRLDKLRQFDLSTKPEANVRKRATARPRRPSASPTRNPSPRSSASSRHTSRGDLTTFDVPLVLHGTPFQRSVWAELLKIPYGETRTYGELAEELGKPGASRAVGLANGKNPVSIIVPCHRVIGASGSLTGEALARVLVEPGRPLCAREIAAFRR